LLVMCCMESAAGPMLKYGVSCRRKRTCAHTCWGGLRARPRRMLRREARASALCGPNKDCTTDCASRPHAEISGARGAGTLEWGPLEGESGEGGCVMR
jgi:hypothetical protein